MEKDTIPQQSVTNTDGQPNVHTEEIDLLELVRNVWDGRKFVFKCCCIAAVVGLVVAFSIPKEYVTTVKLSPEVANKGTSSLSGLGALADIAGVSVGNMNSTDAMYPMLYPDIVASIPFTIQLFDVQVTSSNGKFQTDVYDYLLNHTRQPWWRAVISLPGKVVGWIFSLFKDEEKEAGVIDPFRLTGRETNVLNMLNERIGIDIDKKSSVITLSVTMQDPLISATLTDTVMYNLQKYITEYRTNKARNDLDFIRKLYDEAQQDYYTTQQKYAQYMDANNNVILRSVRTEQERLQNEVSLAYNVYTQTSQQLQMAKVKVQENTPVYAVLQPATVPISATKPSRRNILIGFVFLGGVASVAWILFANSFKELFQKDK